MANTKGPKGELSVQIANLDSGDLGRDCSGFGRLRRTGGDAIADSPEIGRPEQLQNLPCRGFHQAEVREAIDRKHILAGEPLIGVDVSADHRDAMSGEERSGGEREAALRYDCEHMILIDQFLGRLQNTSRS
jgi:hypothetical protein